MRLSVGPNLDDLKARAEVAVNAALAGSDGYARKIAEAQRVLDGQASASLAAEAKARKVKPLTLARSVLAQAAAADARELARVTLNLAIRAAKTEGALMDLLKEAGISLPRQNGGLPCRLKPFTPTIPAA